MNDPAVTASDQGTPNKKAKGLNAQPNINSKVRVRPTHPRPDAAQHAVEQGDERHKGQQHRPDIQGQVKARRSPACRGVDDVHRRLVVGLVRQLHLGLFRFRHEHFGEQQSTWR